jgi:hypothetical protein
MPNKKEFQSKLNQHFSKTFSSILQSIEMCWREQQHLQESVHLIMHVSGNNQHPTVYAASKGFGGFQVLQGK